jgi:heme exporter protein D
MTGGDTKYSFNLTKTTGVLSVTTPLVQSTTSVINLIVKATDDCWSGFYEMSSHRTFAWNPADTSLLLVQINVMISVKFSSSVFYAAVRKEAQFGLPVLPLAVGSSHELLFVRSVQTANWNSIKLCVSCTGYPWDYHNHVINTFSYQQLCGT